MVSNLYRSICLQDLMDLISEQILSDLVTNRNPVYLFIISDTAMDTKSLSHMPFRPFL